MTYATIVDVEKGFRTLVEGEDQKVSALLKEAGVIIDAYNSKASADAKKVVSCRMVRRAIGDGSMQSVPMGSTQGSMSALGYSQSWTLAGGGSGELYLGKIDKKLLGVGDRIGSYSPLEAMCETSEAEDES